MATKKKTKKKATKSKQSDGKKSPEKQPVQKRKTPKKPAKRKSSANKPVIHRKVLEKTIREKTKSRTARGKSRNENQQRSSPAFSSKNSATQSGDLQGLSNVENVDSESVDELMEEGNAFEAGIVSGVEDSGGRDGKEVRTREVPEDDVPGEYLDEE